MTDAEAAPAVQPAPPAGRDGSTPSPRTPRRRRGVPRGYQYLPEPEERRRLLAYERYPNDAKAARALGLRAAHIFLAWRKRRGLPPKVRPGKGRSLPPEEEARRRRAYEDGLSDREAAGRLGIAVGAFTGWRAYHGLRARKDPGRGTPSKLSVSQRRVLAHLRDHPWSTAGRVAVDLGMAAESAASDRIGRLARRGLLQACLHRRARKYALPGAALPEGASPFRAGWSSPYHRPGLREDVLRVLRETPWMSARMIRKRVGAGATDAAAQYAARTLEQRGDLVSRVFTSQGQWRVRLYAPAGGPSFRGPHAVRVRCEYATRHGTPGVAVQVLDDLRRHPWSTVDEIAGRIPRSKWSLHTRIARMEREGSVRRILVPAEGRTARGSGVALKHRWAPAGAKPPESLVATSPGEPWTPRTASMARAARIVQARPGCTAADATAEYRRRYGKGTYAHVCGLLKELVRLGVLDVVARGRAAGRYTANGRVPEVVARAADPHWHLIRKSASKLRELGYRVEIELRPPGGP